MGQGALSDALHGHPDDFTAYLGDLGAQVDGAWEHADTPELIGLERWGTELAERDHRLVLAALIAAAQCGFPIAMAVAGDAVDGMGFHASEPHGDGAPVETQIAVVARWLGDPTKDVTQSVAKAYDRTRQLHAWDGELNPPDDQAYFWYLEVGQCCCAATLAGGNDPDGDSYYDWPVAVTIGRGLVMAARGIRFPGTTSADAITTLHARRTA